MNIYDIAKLSGVSIATVSRVLNGSPKSAKTKQKSWQLWNRKVTHQIYLHVVSRRFCNHRHHLSRDRR
ncbi:MAG: LacI family DNA-binding transcriptional regulator [Anaerostipes hadrus]